MAHQSTLPVHRQSLAGRKLGYVVGAAVNAILLGAVNLWPGWDTLPFLTRDTEQVLGWVNASILAGVAANIVYAVADPPRLKALGDGLQNVVGIAAIVKLWQVFPFDFADGGFDWGLLTRVLLGIAAFGSVVGLVVALVRLVREGRA